MEGDEGMESGGEEGVGDKEGKKMKREGRGIPSE